MKTAEEILNEILADVENRPVFFREQDVADLIAQAQKEAYNQALEDAYLLGKVSYELRQSGDNPIYEYRIDKQSILKLKK